MALSDPGRVTDKPAMRGFPLDPSGLWREVRADPSRSPVPALFLDRDGTLIELVDYLRAAEQVVPIAGAFESLAAVRRRGYRVVIVTNQSGIGRGFYGWEAFAAVQKRVLALADAAGGLIDAVYACPALPDSGDPCRKPGSGMLHAAAADLGIDLARSWIVGDSVGDLEAGRRAGLARGWLVRTGYGARDRAAAAGLADGGFPITIGRPITALGAALSVAGPRPTQDVS